MSNRTLYVDVYEPVCGWKAVLMDPEEGPVQTASFPARNEHEAALEALAWALAECHTVSDRVEELVPGAKAQCEKGIAKFEAWLQEEQERHARELESLPHTDTDTNPDGFELPF